MPSKLPRSNSAKRERADRALALRSALVPLAEFSREFSHALLAAVGNTLPEQQT